MVVYPYNSQFFAIWCKQNVKRDWTWKSPVKWREKPVICGSVIISCLFPPTFFCDGKNPSLTGKTAKIKYKWGFSRCKKGRWEQTTNYYQLRIWVFSRTTNKCPVPLGNSSTPTQRDWALIWPVTRRHWPFVGGDGKKPQISTRNNRAVNGGGFPVSWPVNFTPNPSEDSASFPVIITRVFSPYT